MKAIPFALALGAALAVASPATADDTAKAKDNPQNKPAVTDKLQNTGSNQEHTDGKLTGSYLRQQYRRNGMITDGSSQVLVLDRDTIDQSGASDLKQVLIRKGIH